MNVNTQQPDDQFSHGDDIHLSKLLSTLWRGKLGIIASVIALSGIGIYTIATTYPVYQADSLIQLEQRSMSPIIFQAASIFGEGEVSTSTEIEIISSRMVLGRAVAQRDLDWRVEAKTAPIIGNILARYDLPIPEWPLLTPFARYGEKLTLSNLQVPSAWLGKDILLTTTSEGFRLELPDGSLHDGQAGIDLTLPEVEFAIHVADLPETPGRQIILKQVSERQAIQSLADRLSIQEQGRGSGILKLQLSGRDPVEVEAILNGISDAYVQQNVLRSSAEAQSGVEFIKSQLPDAEARLSNAQTALNTFREETSNRARLQTWPEAASDQSFEAQALLSQITRLEFELRQASQEVENTRARYDEAHPMMRKALSEREKLEMELGVLLNQVDRLPEVEREIINLTRDVELAQQIYLDLQSRYQEMQVLQASAVGSVRIIDAAAASIKPIAPRKSQILFFSMFVGLVLGGLLVLIRDWMRGGIRGSSDLERIGLPVFATLAESQLVKNSSRRQSVFALEQPDDIVVESLRSLRTSLHFGMIGSETKALALTSAAPGAGKTTTAVNLAVVAAQGGQKVALIDADLRRGQVHKYFKLPRRGVGLSEVLAGKATLDAALVEIPSVPGLHVLPAGRYPPNPSELLMRKEMADVIQTLNETYDLIILDTPPTLAVTDPVIVARLAGTTIMVVRHAITPLREVEAVTKVFKSAGLRIAGAVLNGFDPKLAHGPDERSGYDYQYSYKTSGQD